MLSLFSSSDASWLIRSSADTGSALGSAVYTVHTDTHKNRRPSECVSKQQDKTQVYSMHTTNDKKNTFSLPISSLTVALIVFGVKESNVMLMVCLQIPEKCFKDIHFFFFFLKA